MPVHANVKSCSHIKVTGHRCGSPALRGEQFCYFHQRMVRGVRLPRSLRIHPMAMIETEEAIQASLMELLNAIVRNDIDLKRAALLLRGFQLAIRNSRRVRFGVDQDTMVQEVPAYAEADTGQAASPAAQDVNGHDQSQENAFEIPYGDAVFTQRWEAEREARQRFFATHGPAPDVRSPNPPRPPQPVAAAQPTTGAPPKTAPVDPTLRKPAEKVSANATERRNTARG